MSIVSEFAAELARRGKMKGGTWHRIDLHNHTPASFDYRGNKPDAIEKTAEAIRAARLSVVMFTDHEVLPDGDFVDQVAKESGATILRGTELNVFVDVYDKKIGKINKDLFYHLLIGFDPNGKQPADYWLAEIYRRCGETQRETNSRNIRGVTQGPATIAEVLREANALIIPAHLHSTKNIAASRSIDDIYDDPQFLEAVRSSFTALEVTDPKTADFFDGKHKETQNLARTCIQSSDAHQPSEIGQRFCYAQMEEKSYDELKAALELPFRVSLGEPPQAGAHVIGMHVTGTFFPELWLSFSPHCNMLIAVKGSGKTSVLECLRYALGADVPKSRAEAVGNHLQAILGPTGRVRVLVRRPDGALVLVERSQADRSFNLTFEDDRKERVTSPDAILFPSQILGWHEIEQAATDMNVRRVYMDTIAGRAQVRTIEEDAAAIGSRIRDRHTSASQRYIGYRDLQRQVSRLRELRSGLQVLKDASLVDLRDKYQHAVEQRENLTRITSKIVGSVTNGSALLSDLIPDGASLIAAQSPISADLKPIVEGLAIGAQRIQADGEAVTAHVKEVQTMLEKEGVKVEASFDVFLQSYTAALDKLTPEQRRLLETHRDVMEQTKALPTLESELEKAKTEVLSLLDELSHLCERLAARLDERTRIRQDAVKVLNQTLVPYGVRLSIVSQQTSSDFSELSSRYSSGAQALSQLRSKVPDRLAHLCLRRAYSGLATSLDSEYGSMLFDSAELGYLLSSFENDDLKIELKVGKPGQEFSPIDQLSAGQRCTAIFPMLLQLDQGPLIVDQPEDNLDNRHIASTIAPALLQDKRRRQMMFTSHNANLVVLSDAESIIMFESDGSSGRVESQGFFATRLSTIGKHVIDVLDGGEAALHLRSLKYGLSKGKN